MTPERWKRVEEVFQAALDCDPTGRRTFLDNACGDDETLRCEVDSLIAAHETGRSFLELSALTGKDEPAPGLVPGERLAGRYQVRALLARGGMGEVYAVDDLELGVPVALKTIRAEVAADPQALRRFKQEVLLARSITHPRVCRVFDLGHHRADGKEVMFLTMELLAGETLAARIGRRGRMREAEALPLVRQMAEALEAAHEAGIVHRDLKSGNVMLVPEGDRERVVVMDFGLAHAAVEAVPAEGGRVAGTPAYMAPEQVRGERTGPAADLYALGVVLFEMVTGRLPFQGESALATARMRLEADPPSPRSLVEIEVRWEEAILRLLRREPKERFARATDLVRWLEGEAATPGPIRHTLPAESDTFVGREAELEELRCRLDAGARLVTVLGPAGVGKTRLVRRFGWSALGRFPGGVWFCDLSDARSLVGIASAVATALAVPLGREDPVIQLGHAIAGRGRALIVLDNFEQVVDHAAATVGRWVERAPEARFVLTSRERLGLAGEDARPLEPLEEKAAVELFLQRARSHRPGFSLREGNQDAVCELVTLLEGLPLAIELAAARLRVLAMTQVLERAKDRFQLLAGGKGASRHATLKAAIDGSWHLLPAWEKRAFAQCSVFEGGFTLEAAEEVLELGPDAPAAMDVVQALVDKSLLRVWVPRALSERLQARFGMYMTLQEYAREKLREKGAVAGGGSGKKAEAQAEERHGRYYAHFGADEAIEALDRHGGVERREALARDLENLMAACQRAIGRRDGETAVATYRAAWAVLELRGPFAVGVEVGRQVLTIEGLAPKPCARALLDAGRALWRAGRMDEARVAFERALAIACEVGDRRLEGNVLGNLGNVHQEVGRSEEGLAHLERALAINREVGSRSLEGVVLTHLGLLHMEQGRLEEGRVHTERALAIAREVGARRIESVALDGLGGVHYDQGRLEEARTHVERALAIAREVADRRHEGALLGNLALVHYYQGRPEQGRELQEQALVVAREIGDRRNEGNVLGNLGVAHSEERRPEEARTHIERALAIAREIRDRRSEGILLRKLGSLHSEQRRPEEARAALAAGERLLREVGDSLEIGELLCERGKAERLRGDASAAGATLEEIESLAASAGAAPTSFLGQALARLRAALDERR